MRIIGHRGAAALAPENTIAAMEAAFDAGADAVEVDVRLTADGELVLLHDPTLDRTTGGTGAVAAMTAAAVASVPIPMAGGATIRVPTLAEAWEAAGGRLVVEIKAEWGTDAALAVVGPLVSFLRGRDAAAAIVSSFDLRVPAAVRAAGCAVATGVLTTAAVDPDSAIAAAVEGGHDYWFAPAAVATGAVVAEAHAAGRSVIAWTCDDPEALRALRDAGADGVICDDPRAARHALGH